MAKRVIRVLSFDPGFGNTGWALTEYNPATEEKVVLKRGLVKITQIANRKAHSDRVSKFGKRTVSVDILLDKLRAVIDECKPDFTVSENAFMNRFRPQAYISLSTWLSTVEYMLMNEYGLTLYRCAPKEVKYTISKDGTSGKESIQDAIAQRDDIRIKCKGGDTSDMTEHESDAIAVSYCFIVKFLPGMGITEILEEKYSVAE